MSIKIYVKYVKNNRDFHTTKSNLPTGNLDKQSGDQIIRFMKETNRLFGLTYIIVTHNKEIADYTDREITIDDGEIISDIDLLDVRENEVIK